MPVCVTITLSGLTTRRVIVAGLLILRLKLEAEMLELGFRRRLWCGRNYSGDGSSRLIAIAAVGQGATQAPQ